MIILSFCVHYQVRFCHIVEFLHIIMNIYSHLKKCFLSYRFDFFLIYNIINLDILLLFFPNWLIQTIYIIPPFFSRFWALGFKYLSQHFSINYRTIIQIIWIITRRSHAHFISFIFVWNIFKCILHGVSPSTPLDQIYQSNCLKGVTGCPRDKTISDNNGLIYSHNVSVKE